MLLYTMYHPGIATHSDGYGEMPYAMLMAKTESTWTPDTTYLYDTTARETLTDWGPDKNKFEHEEPRGRVNARSATLQLRYGGHRGDADDYYTPERFDGFHGAEDRDPRGISTDPDMRKMATQTAARNRFIKFSPDQCEQLTGGGGSEAKDIKDFQTLMKTVKERLKVFTRSLDGRREGMRRFFQHKSDVTKSIRVQSYGDFITDYALTPQRRAVLISKQILRDSKAYREETADADFAVAKYTLICRRGGKEFGRVPRSTESDITYGGSDGAKHYTALAVLMSNITNQRAHLMKGATGDGDRAESTATVARASAPFVRDLTAILAATTGDGRAGESDATVASKSAMPVLAEHLGRVTDNDAVTPAALFLTAEKMYKAAAGDGDARKNAEKTTSDAVHVGVRETATTAVKRGREGSLFGAKLARAYDTDRAESMNVFNYKTLASRREHGARKFGGEMGYSDATDVRDKKQSHKLAKGQRPGDTAEDMKYADNTQKDRRGGKIGSKYTRRYMRRDTREGDLGDF